MVKKEANIQYINQSDNLKLGLINLTDFSHPMTGGKREVEKAAARYLVSNTSGIAESEILYKESGRPYLQGGPEISISHSYDLLGVLFSSNGTKVGLDIEKVRDKIFSIKHKFLSSAELKELDGADARFHTLYWAVKEAVYKASCLQGLAFAEQISVTPFEMKKEGGTVEAWVNHPALKMKFCLCYFSKDEYVIAYTLNS